MEKFLYPIIALTGSVHIAAFYLKKPIWRLFLKPATTILVIVLALMQPVYIPETYRILILAGLVFSLIGDVMLVLPKEQFIPGLVSFFIAHILFIVAFSLDFGFQWEWIFFIIVLVVMSPYLWILFRNTKEMTFPVVAYALVLLVLLWQTLARFWFYADSRSTYIFLGTLLFVFSDSVLAYNKFVKKILPAELLFMVTYWSALILFALSI
ncbi:MAG: lysoplasmalogenase [Bacteroidales bacterium]|nr:lysoplasmalogenase [Bacteroidales bacterium]